MIVITTESVGLIPEMSDCAACVDPYTVCVALHGIVPGPPRNPSGLLLLVHPSDIELPVEQLQVELHVKPKGYLRETLLSATRLIDYHCSRGQAHLIAER